MHLMVNTTVENVRHITCISITYTFTCIYYVHVECTKFKILAPQFMIVMSLFLLGYKVQWDEESYGNNIIHTLQYPPFSEVLVVNMFVLGIL